MNRRVGKRPELAMGFDPAKALAEQSDVYVVLCGDYLDGNDVSDGTHDDQVDALVYALKMLAPKPRWRCGWLFRWGSCWIGAHWSPRNKRLCVNLIPCVTFWVAAPGGKTPAED